MRLLKILLSCWINSCSRFSHGCVALIVLLSCSSYDEKVVGKWVVFKAQNLNDGDEIEFDSAYNAFTLNLNPNGSMVVENTLGTYEGAWAGRGNAELELLLIFDGDTSIVRDVILSDSTFDGTMDTGVRIFARSIR